MVTTVQARYFSEELKPHNQNKQVITAVISAIAAAVFIALAALSFAALATALPLVGLYSVTVLVPLVLGPFFAIKAIANLVLCISSAINAANTKDVPVPKKFVKLIKERISNAQEVYQRQYDQFDTLVATKKLKDIMDYIIAYYAGPKAQVTTGSLGEKAAYRCAEKALKALELYDAIGKGGPEGNPQEFDNLKQQVTAEYNLIEAP